jgi:hypothetical protein
MAMARRIGVRGGRRSKGWGSLCLLTGYSEHHEFRAVDSAPFLPTDGHTANLGAKQPMKETR